MNFLADAILQCGVVHDLPLTGKQDALLRQFGAPVDNPVQQIHHVITMDEGLTGLLIACEQMAFQITLVNARYLVAKGGNSGFFVVEARKARHDDGDLPPVFQDYLFGAGLGFRIGPAGPNCTVFVDQFTR